MGDRRMVFGDGLEDIKDCFLGSVPSSSGGGGGLFSRPVIIGSVLLLWLFGLTIALIVVSSKYADLSIVALSSRLDGVEQHHADKHTFALQKIGAVAASHRDTAQALGEPGQGGRGCEQAAGQDQVSVQLGANNNQL